MTERELAGCLRDLAEMFGWLRYHTWISKHSPAGFPDEVLLRGPRLIVAELKSETGKPSKAQQVWLDAFRAIPSVEVYLWRPSDLDEIAEALR